MKRIIFVISTSIFAQASFAQDMSSALSGDSLRTYNLAQVEILSKKFSSAEERKVFERLKYNTLKGYPYAQMASRIYEEMKEGVSETDKRRSRKKFVNEIKIENKKLY